LFQKVFSVSRQLFESSPQKSNACFFIRSIMQSSSIFFFF
jgi:hypothetical protein